MRCAILATGPSMSQTVADSVRDFDIVVAVNDAFRLAPWATALAAQDHAWWRINIDAKEFTGRKFTANKIEGTEQIISDLVSRGSSSGVLGLEVARKLIAECGYDEEKLIELYGYDNHSRTGHHYFGRHKEPLRTTNDSRFKAFADQIAVIGRHIQKKDGIRIVNKTPDSALTCFDRG